MNSNKIVKHLRTIATTAVAATLLGAQSTAVAVPTPPPAFGACFGFFGFVGAAGPLMEIDGTPGLETVVVHRNDTLNDDTDMNGLSTARSNFIVNAHDEDGSPIWQKAGLSLETSEIWQANAALLGLTPGTFFTAPPGISGVYPLTFNCQAIGQVDVGGNSYIMLIGGATGATGTTAAGTDLTKLRAWLLDLGGNLVNSAPLNISGLVDQGTGLSSTYIVAQTSGVLDIDGDGDDELVLNRVEARGQVGNKQRAWIHTDVIGLMMVGDEYPLESTSKVNFSYSFNNDVMPPP